MLKDVTLKKVHATEVDKPQSGRFGKVCKVKHPFVSVYKPTYICDWI